jgi:hypothetical protein
MRNFTLAALVFCAFLPGASRAQLAVNTSLPIATLVNSLVDNSVKLSNITVLTSPGDVSLP